MKIKICYEGSVVSPYYLNLFVQRKVFYCGRCHSKQTFREDCQSEQEDEEQQSQTKQNKNREQQDLPEATPELHQDVETPSERIKVEQNKAAPRQQIEWRVVSGEWC